MEVNYWHETMMTDIFPFTEEGIKKYAWAELIGNYQLGCLDEDGSFRVLYVGRTTDGIRKRLSCHIGKFPDVTHFACSVSNSEKMAYEQECIDYHHFKEEMGTAIYNEIHPARPAGTDYPCPVEDCTELD